MDKEKFGRKNTEHCLLSWLKRSWTMEWLARSSWIWFLMQDLVSDSISLIAWFRWFSCSVWSLWLFARYHHKFCMSKLSRFVRFIVSHSKKALQMEKSRYFTPHSSATANNAALEKQEERVTKAKPRKRRHVIVEYSEESNVAPTPSTDSVGEPDPVKTEPGFIPDGVMVKVEPKAEVGQSIKSELWEPPNWREQLDGIREMRKNRDAPVDTMGCERCHDHDALPQVQR